MSDIKTTYIFSLNVHANPYVINLFIYHSDETPWQKNETYQYCPMAKNTTFSI